MLLDFGLKLFVLIFPNYPPKPNDIGDDQKKYNTDNDAQQLGNGKNINDSSAQQKQYHGDIRGNESEPSEYFAVQSLGIISFFYIGVISLLRKGASESVYYQIDPDADPDD